MMYILRSRRTSSGARSSRAVSACPRAARVDQQAPPVASRIAEWPVPVRRFRRRLDEHTTAFVVRRLLDRTDSAVAQDITDEEVERFSIAMGTDLDRAVHTADAWLTRGGGSQAPPISTRTPVLAFTVEDLGLGLADNPAARAEPERIRLMYRVGCLALVDLACPLYALPDDEIRVLARMNGVLEVRQVRRPRGDHRPDQSIVVFCDEKALLYVVRAIPRYAGVSLPTPGDCALPLAR